MLSARRLRSTLIDLLPFHLKHTLETRSLARYYTRSIAEAQANKDRDKAAELADRYMFESRILDDEAAQNETRALIREARRLRVPVPVRTGDDDSESNWRQSEFDGGWYLTVRGLRRVREEVRTERLARQQVRAHWAVWLAAVTGLIGALTGLFAVLLR